MKKFIAIGHWSDSKNMTSVACEVPTNKSFRNTLAGNAFIPYVVISEKKMEVLKNTSGLELYDEVKKLTSNHRRWIDVTEYIEQCFDIMEERMANA